MLFLFVKFLLCQNTEACLTWEHLLNYDFCACSYVMFVVKALLSILFAQEWDFQRETKRERETERTKEEKRRTRWGWGCLSGLVLVSYKILQQPALSGYFPESLILTPHCLFGNWYLNYNPLLLFICNMHHRETVDLRYQHSSFIHNYGKCMHISPARIHFTFKRCVLSHRRNFVDCLYLYISACVYKIYSFTFWSINYLL